MSPASCDNALCRSIHKEHPPAHAARSQGTRLQKGDSCSGIRTVQEGEKQFDINHCREPNFQVFGLHDHPRRTTWTVPKPLQWKKVCFLPLQIKNSINPLFFFIFSLNTWNTKRYLYNLWCYHYTHTYSSSLLWMSTAECQGTENKQTRIKLGEWRESRSWSILCILHCQEKWF